MASDPKLRPVKWTFDIYRKEFVPRPDPLPVPPTGIFDDTLYCMQFNALWMPHILGALELLLQPDSWSGGDSEVFRAQQAIYTMLANVTVCGEPMRMIELQAIGVDGCNQFQWKYTDEPIEAWRNLGDLICDGAQGEPGATGAQGPQGNPGATGATGAQGEPGECPDCPETNPPTDPIADDLAICGIANYLIDMLIALNDEAIAQVKVQEDAFDVVSIIVASIPGIEVFGIVAQFVNALFGTSITQYESDFTVQAVEDMKCDLYNVLKASGGVFNAASTWSAWITRHRLRGFNANFEIFYTSIGARTTNWWNARAALGSFDANPFCSVCVTEDQILVGWQLASSTVNELTGANRVFKLKLTTPSPLGIPVTVNIIGIDGTATSAGNDYLVMTPQVTFPVGSSDGALLDVEVFIPEDLDNTDETFTLRIDSVVNGTIDDAHKDHVVTVKGVVEWCYDFDFTATNGGFTVISGFGTWVSGTGWRGVDPAGSPVMYAAYIKKTFTSVNITKIEVVVTVPGGINAGSNMGIFNGASVIANPNLIVGTNTYIWNGSVTSSELRINPNDTSQNFTVTNFRVWGTGTNPFGTDNC